MQATTSTNAAAQNGRNKVRPEDRAVHDWSRFALSFPPHLVQYYLERFGVDLSCTVLDPFCGIGTTLVECKKLGIASAIERRRMELGKASGFERLYPRVTQLYFGDMLRHLASLRK